MSETRGDNDAKIGRETDATNSRTLDKLEEAEKIPSNIPQSTVPSPDEGSRHAPDDDARDQR